MEMTDLPQSQMVPHNREAEEALLGSVLIDGSIMALLDLKPEDFYIHRYGWVYQAFLDLSERGVAIDFITVTNELEETGKLEEFGGMSKLTALLDRPATFLHAQDYAEIIIDNAVKRRALRVANKLAKGVYDNSLDFAEIIGDLTKAQRVKGEALHISHYLSELYDDVQERAGDPKAIWGIPTGFPDLDKRIGGLQTQETLYLSAPPGAGKSILAMQTARNASKNVPVAIFSFEMSAVRLLRRILSAETGVSVRAMRTGWMDNKWDDFNKGIVTLEKLPIYISDIYGMTTASVRAEVAKLKARHGIKVIVVDYLNRLLDSDSEGELENTKQKARRMQSLCREFDVAGIIIQSMTKEGMKAAVLKLDHMSGPADVAHEGDSVFLLQKDDDVVGQVNLLPAKLRDGDMGTKPIELLWKANAPMFVSVSRQEGIEERYHE